MTSLHGGSDHRFWIQTLGLNPGSHYFVASDKILTSLCFSFPIYKTGKIIMSKDHCGEQKNQYELNVYNSA